MNVNYGGVHLV